MRDLNYDEVAGVAGACLLGMPDSLSPEMEAQLGRLARSRDERRASGSALSTDDLGEWLTRRSPSRREAPRGRF